MSFQTLNRSSNRTKSKLLHIEDTGKTVRYEFRIFEKIQEDFRLVEEKFQLYEEQCLKAFTNILNTIRNYSNSYNRTQPLLSTPVIQVGDKRRLPLSSSTNRILIHRSKRVKCSRTLFSPQKVKNSIDDNEEHKVSTKSRTNNTPTTKRQELLEAKKQLLLLSDEKKKKAVVNRQNYLENKKQQLRNRFEERQKRLKENQKLVELNKQASLMRNGNKRKVDDDGDESVSISSRLLARKKKIANLTKSNADCRESKEQSKEQLTITSSDNLVKMKKEIIESDIQIDSVLSPVPKINVNDLTFNVDIGKYADSLLMNQTKVIFSTKLDNSIVDLTKNVGIVDLISSTITKQQTMISSYEMTPPPRPYPNPQNYDITTLMESDDEESMIRANTKPIPRWAQGRMFANIIKEQFKKPDELNHLTKQIFPHAIPLPVPLEANGLIVNQKYATRSSSVSWCEKSFIKIN